MIKKTMRNKMMHSFQGNLCSISIHQMKVIRGGCCDQSDVIPPPPPPKPNTGKAENAGG